MINIDHLRLHVVRPTLLHIQRHTAAAENLVIGTALTESHGEYLRQVGGGPALGLWQMEPATHDDIWLNWLRYRRELAARVHELETPADITRGALELTGNLYYGAAMCRIHYWRLPDALPEADDEEGMARFWKLHYNTPLGAGSVAEALPHFEEACR